MRVVVAYDVSDDGERAKLAATLSSLGERLQKSVFLCDLDDQQLDAMLHRAATLIEHNTDSVHVFAQCPQCAGQVRTVGQAHVPKAVEYWVVG